MKRLLPAVIVSAFIALSPNTPMMAQSGSALTASAMAGNAASAIATLRTITSAQIMYSVTCGNGGYASSLKVLATPPPGATDAFLTTDLKPDQPEKAGYQFVLTAGAKSSLGPTDCAGNKTVTKFYAAATPLKPGVSGTRSFAVTDSNTIWVLDGAVAPKEPFGPPAKPLN